MLALLAPACHLLPPPSDATLERNFHENQKDFEQLRLLIAQDSSEGIVEMVFEDYTVPGIKEAYQRGFSEDRLRRYRGLIRHLRLKGVMRLGDDIVFEASAFGLLTGGTYKGYLYVKDEPRHLEQTLDGVSGGNCDYLARPLQGRWYLYFRDCTTRDTKVQHGSPSS